MIDTLLASDEFEKKTKLKNRWEDQKLSKSKPPMFTHEQRRDDRLYKKKCFLECRDYEYFKFLQKLRDTQEG